MDTIAARASVRPAASRPPRELVESIGAERVLEVKCLFAIDAIAAVYKAGPAVGDCPGLPQRRFRAPSIQAAMDAGFGCFPNQVFRIASRTSEPRPGE